MTFMENYAELSKNLMAFSEAFNGEISIESIESYAEKFPEELIQKAKKYFFNVSSAQVALSQMNQLTAMPLALDGLTVEDKLFKTILIQIIIAGLVNTVMSEESSETKHGFSDISSLKNTDFIDDESLIKALKLAASVDVNDDDARLYQILKLYMGIMPIHNFIYYYVEYIGNEALNTSRQSNTMTKSLILYKRNKNLEYLLRNLVRDIWNNSIKPIKPLAVKRLMSILQDKFLGKTAWPTDVLGGILASSVKNNEDDSIKINRLGAYGFNFDIPERVLKSLTPYYAAIGFDLHEKTISAIRKHSNLPLESNHVDLNGEPINRKMVICPPYIMYDQQIDIDLIEPFHLNILKFMYANHRDVLLAHKPSLLINMIYQTSDILFGMITSESIYIFRDNLLEDLPISMKDESYVGFFDLLHQLINDSDFINYDSCILDMLCIVEPNYIIIVPSYCSLESQETDFESMEQISLEEPDRVILSNAIYLNQKCSEGDPKYIENYVKYRKNPFYNEIFNLFATVSPALNALRKRCSVANNGLFDESTESSNDLPIAKLITPK